MTEFLMLGCGFVADLYMRSLALYPEAKVVGVWDTDPARLATFCDHWSVPAVENQAALFAAAPGAVVLNLTNPDAHFETSQAALAAGHPVYSEKPLAMRTEDARALTAQADAAGLMLASAPCSMLGEAAQIFAKAARDDVAGKARLIYAELDDGFIPKAPWRDWKSESGAPWPGDDEFRVGCTLEHAGYVLTWLIAAFGSITRVVAAADHTIGDLLPEGAAPDTTVASLFFENGPMARLTCSIVAPHDHRLRLVGDTGLLEVDEVWNNAAPVKYRKRIKIRRRFMESPLTKRIKPKGESHPKVGRWGAAAMNFALGPMEMATALAGGRACRMTSDFALHLTEVTLAIQNAGPGQAETLIESRCPPMELDPWA